jgi:hypothetical protein
VIQANLAVTELARFPNHSGDLDKQVGQLGFFAYLRDTAHPTLHPIAIVMLVASSGFDAEYYQHGALSYDYSSQMNDDGPNGVWFASGAVGANTAYTTTGYSQGNANAAVASGVDPNAPMQFWRTHVTPANLANIVMAINQAYPACAAVGCPQAGYSANFPADLGNYVLEYAGLIMELALVEDTYDTAPGDTDQISMGFHGEGLGIYRYLVD